MFTLFLISTILPFSATFAEWEGMIIIVLTALMAIFGFAANVLTILVIRSSVALKG